MREGPEGSWEVPLVLVTVVNWLEVVSWQAREAGWSHYSHKTEAVSSDTLY